MVLECWRMVMVPDTVPRPEWSRRQSALLAREGRERAVSARVRSVAWSAVILLAGH